MKQLNLPKKQVALGKVWISMLLILLTVIFAFTPIISIDMKDSAVKDTINEGIAGLAKETPGLSALSDYTIPDEVGVTSGKVIDSVKILTKLMSVGIKTAMAAGTTQTSEDKAKLEKAQKDLIEMIESDEGKEAIVMTIALFSNVADFSGEKAPETTDKTEEKTDSNVGMVLQKVISVIVLIYLLGFIAIFPYIMLIFLVINLIKALSALNDPEKVAGKVSGVLNTSIVFTVVTGIVMAVLPGIVWGSGLTTIFVLAIVNVVINLVSTRLRSYNDADFMYLNLTQGAALIQLVGFLVFFVNLTKVGFIKSYLNSLGDYLADVTKDIANINANITAYNSYNDPNIKSFVGNMGYLVEIFVAIAFALLALSAASKLISAIVSRLGLCVGKSKLVNDGIGNAVVALIAPILPFVLANLKNAKSYDYKGIENGAAIVESETLGAVYNMPADTKSALIGMIVGAVIVLAAAIALKVLKGKFCGVLSPNYEFQMLQGMAEPVVTAEAPAVEAEAPVAEANDEETK